MTFVYKEYEVKIQLVAPWCIGYHYFIQQSLNSGSAQVQILFTVCQRCKMVRISDNGPSWK